jgi:hypothetical protein
MSFPAAISLRVGLVAKIGSELTVRRKSLRFCRQVGGRHGLPELAVVEVERFAALHQVGTQELREGGHVALRITGSQQFYAGLMAYNLVRGLIAAAAEQSGCRPLELSFTKVHGLLASILTELFLSCMSNTARASRLEWLLAEASTAKLPRRRRPRQSEPRAQYYPPQTFPKIKGSRDEARRALKKSIAKS